MVDPHWSSTKIDGLPSGGGVNASGRCSVYKILPSGFFKSDTYRSAHCLVLKQATTRVCVPCRAEDQQGSRSEKKIKRVFEKLSHDSGGISYTRIYVRLCRRWAPSCYATVSRLSARSPPPVRQG